MRESGDRAAAGQVARPTPGYVLALWFGKVVYYAVRLTGRRGSALPGLIVERLFPRFLRSALRLVPGGVIVVTGTNGKTTSTKMLTQILERDRTVLTNPTGSNMTRGIIASILPRATWSGSLAYDLAVLELDEAYAARFAAVVKPRATLVTNVMRDQLDRFGEIDRTARLLGEVVAATEDVVVLNRDDPRVAAMAGATQACAVFFGVASGLHSLFPNDDELHGSMTAAPPPRPPQAISRSALVELRALDEDHIVLDLNGTAGVVRLAASSTHNAQNAAGVAAMALALGIAAATIVDALSAVQPAFGRGEQIDVGGRKVVLQLVKNPGGFRHALVSHRGRRYDQTMIAINDDFADGRDVSWLWDVDFTDAARCPHVCTTGSRAHDMELRLKYDGITVEAAEPSLEKALDQTLEQTPPKANVIIYSTYTAMLALRRLLSRRAHIEKV